MYTLRRWVFLLTGLVLFGAGIALMVRAELGLGPWEVLHQGISRATGIAIGTVSILLGLPIMLAWLPLGQRPGVGTLLNIVLVGGVTDVVLQIMPEVHNILLRVALLLIGILLIGIGSGAYLSSAMGAGPRDGLMLGLTKRTGWNIRITRTLIELSVLLIGVLMGGTIGVGTLAFAFGIGPVVQVALPMFARLGSPRAEVVAHGVMRDA